MKRLYDSARLRILRLVLRILVRRVPRGDLRRLGSRDCGWIVPTTLLGPGSVCYCAGAGEDISFDLELARDLGCEVFVFDPTPRARTYVEGLVRGGAPVTFLPVGIWVSDGVSRFYAPRDPRHVSHSLVNLQRTTDHFDAEVRTISSLMRGSGHPALALLKLDIEGPEHAVLRDVIDAKVVVDVICVEFDQPVPLSTVLGTIKRMQGAGFEVCSSHWMDFTFVRRGAVRV